jgi:uncharacterized small protein (DUF1192 family)
MALLLFDCRVQAEVTGCAYRSDAETEYRIAFLTSECERLFLLGDKKSKPNTNVTLDLLR